MEHTTGTDQKLSSLDEFVLGYIAQVNEQHMRFPKEVEIAKALALPIATVDASVGRLKRMGLVEQVDVRRTWGNA